MPATVDWPKMYRRNMAKMMQVRENIVRTRVENGGPMSTEEKIAGVRLSHEEFLYLARMAMPALNHELSETA